MRLLVGILIVLALSACGAATTSGDGGATGSSAAGVAVSEPWVRAAVLLDASASSGVDMNASTGAEASADASAMGDMSASGGMDMAASGGMDMGGAVSAGYMTLRNDGAQADRLVGASSDVAGEVQLHTSEMKDNVMSMRQVEAIDVPAGGTATLEPGGYHLMMLDLKRDLKAGDTVRLTLRFERAGTVEVDAEVREAGAEH